MQQSGSPIQIPGDVLELVHSVFAGCNDEVSETISRIPNTQETALDQMFISYLNRTAPAVAPTSGWIIDFETHFLGGTRQFGRWEIADIGVIVAIRRGSTTMWSKVALLQSKRLFPLTEKYDPEAEVGLLRWGFGRLLKSHKSLSSSRRFKFSERSRYESLDLNAQQATQIELYTSEVGFPVHYLLYNPAEIPSTVSVPSRNVYSVVENRVGCRIVRAEQMRSLRGKKIVVPTYGDVRDLAAPHSLAPFAAGWRLEDFIVTLLLGCHEGRVVDPSLDEAVDFLFYRRNYPIAAAFVVNIEIAE